MARLLGNPFQLTRGGILKFSSAAMALTWALFGPTAYGARPLKDEIEDITGEYHFLSPDDTLALLEEDGKLKGYIDVYQSEEESDTVLSYTITSGWRKQDQVEFKTSKIHQRYYRFAGRVERGRGQEEKDQDYLPLVGDLEIVSITAADGGESVNRVHAVLKSMGKAEKPEDSSP